MPKSPIFIVGSPRSGTSALVDTLLSAGYGGYREGNFLSLITPIKFLIDRHRHIFADPSSQILASQIDFDQFSNSLFKVFRGVTETVTPWPLWFDKTGNPEMIEAIPTLRALWPDSAFIFAKRRGIENVNSRLRKFPQHAFEYHCSDWARNMAAWRTMRDGLPDDAKIEIDQQDMTRSPEEVTVKLIDFLDVDERRRDAVLQTVRSGRPQETEQGSAERVYSLDTVEWLDDQKDIFRQKCMKEMREFGYSIDVNYWSPGAAAQK